MVIEGPRVLAVTLDQLGDALGVPIHYEDPDFEASCVGEEGCEVEDVTAELCGAEPHPCCVRGSEPCCGRPRVVLVPKSTRLVISEKDFYEFDTGNQMDRLLGLLAAYDGQGGPGKFQLIRVLNVPALIPNRVGDGEGGSRASRRPLDTVIDLDKEGSAVEIIALLLDKVRRASGADMRLGTVPGGALHEVRIRVSAQRVPAREVLAEILGQVEAALAEGRWRLAWRLFFDAGYSTYFLNLRPVWSSGGK